MEIISHPFFPIAYQNTLSAVLNLGKMVSPRGKKTLELQPATIVSYAPNHRWLFFPRRGLNYAFGLAEAVCLFTGHNSVDYLSFYNSKIAKFSDNGIRFHGHYGERLNENDQVERLIEVLRGDKDTRQGVLSIWNDMDLGCETFDKPCNVMLMFVIRDNLLNCVVIRRSSDLILGVPYDHMVLNLLHIAIAQSLSCGVGGMTEVATSLHYYVDRDADVVNTMMNPPSGFRLKCNGLSCERSNLSYERTKHILKHFVAEDLEWRSASKESLRDRIRGYALLYHDVCPWWANAFRFMGSYHLWRARRWNEFFNVIGELSDEFKEVTRQTFEARALKKNNVFNDTFHYALGERRF